jgi:hypothetical protein
MTTTKKTEDFSGAFSGCVSLTGIELPAAKNIGENAFEGCKRLSSVYCPSVRNIASGAFRGCVNLKHVYLPSMIDIAPDAFEGCPVSAEEVLRRSKMMITIRKDASTYPVLNAPDTFVFDGESVNWDDEKLGCLFDLLAVQNIPLPYALAIEFWKPDNTVVLPKGTKWNNGEAYDALVAETNDGFGGGVECERTRAAILLPDGSDDSEGVLVKSVESEIGFGYLGLFVSFFKAGPNLDIQIYTLYLPTNADADTDAKRAASLKRNVNPKHAAFINSLRDIVIRVAAEHGSARSSIY